jgi:hypothetical protein
MPDPVIMPIDILTTGKQFTATIAVGANATPLKMLLDTGSSTLAASRAAYNPDADTNATHTNLLQTAQYGATAMTGAVINTSLIIAGADPASAVTLAAAQLAVTYDTRPDNFAGADGIIGLAYKSLENAFLMPADTWQTQYSAGQTYLGTQADVPTLFDQLATANLCSNKFAFGVRRSLKCAAQADPAADPLNTGIFVAGGGAERTELYAGALTSVAVVHEKYYNTNLLAIQVGSEPAIAVSPPAASSLAASNSVIDTGVFMLLLSQPVYDLVVASFAAINPVFADQLKSYAANGSNSGDQAPIDLAAWPTLTLTFQGVGGDAVLTVAPPDYWQFDALAKGQAFVTICGDNNAYGGLSFLGLPLFCDKYVVFDRAADVIGFAAGA